MQATQRSVGRGSGSGAVAAGADVVVAVGGVEAPVALLAEPRGNKTICGKSTPHVLTHLLVINV